MLQFQEKMIYIRKCTNTDCKNLKQKCLNF